MERNANAYYKLQSHAFDLLRERICHEGITDYDESYDEISDAIHEIADDVTPHYYHEIFTVMAADGIDADFNDSGLIPDTKDVTKICQARIYEQLSDDMFANVEEFIADYVNSGAEWND